LTCAAFINGDVVRLLAPYAGDSEDPSNSRNLKSNIKDEQCGQGSASERKYLFIPHLLEDDDIFRKTQCVAKCPLSSDTHMFGNSEPYDSEPCIFLCNGRL